MSSKEHEDEPTSSVPLTNHSATTRNPNLVRDSTFYCYDMFILVETVVFKIPRVLLNGSEVFRGMLDIPQSADHASDGATEENPLILNGYSSAEFRQLLRVILPLSYGAQDELTSKQWITVLKLSSVWEFGAVRKVAIESLSKARLDPVEKLIMAIRYDVTNWTVEALNSICQRPTPIGTEDADRLREVVDSAYIFKITSTRETANTPDRQQFDFRPSIRVTFKLE